MNALVQSLAGHELATFALSVVLGSTIVMVVALLLARLLENNAAARHGVLAAAMLAVLVCPGVTLVTQCLGFRWLRIPVPAMEAVVSSEPSPGLPPRAASEEQNAAGYGLPDLTG